MTGKNGLGQTRGLRFTRLCMERWRNFKDAELKFGKRAFFVGPNASGKSNILDALRFLRDVASGQDGLRTAVEQRGGMRSIRSLHATRSTDITLSVDVGTEGTPNLWSYELQFKGRDSNPIVHKEVVLHRGKEVLSRPDNEDKKDKVRLTQSCLGQTSANKQFRPLATFFKSVRYTHVIPQLIREPDRSAGRKNDSFGGDFLAQMGVDPKKEERLKRINKALKIAAPNFRKLDLVQTGGFWHLEANFEHWRAYGANQSEADLSDGTLRLIGFLWSLQEGKGPLLLEEPELNLHEELVRQLPGIMARIGQETGRQLLITTHSRELLNDIGISPDEVHLLVPSGRGTNVQVSSDVKVVRSLMALGEVPAGEAIMPHAAPKDISRLLIDV